MRKVKIEKCTVLCILLLGQCFMKAFSETSHQDENSMTVVLSAKDIQHESEVTEKPMNTSAFHNDNQIEMKSSVSQVVKQTEMIGTVEHPTIEGGLISAPELVEVLSEEAPEVADETTLAITSKLNEIFNRSPAYNSKVLFNMVIQTYLNARENLRAKSRQIWKLWLRSHLTKTNKAPSINQKRAKYHGKH